ncbi:phosphodiester glycosidase family protein [Flavobacteriaceae bacterium MHTCC 0001]
MGCKKIIFTSLLALSICCCTLSCKVSVKSPGSLNLTQIFTDSLFNSKQKIHLLSFKDKSDYSIDIGYSKSSLLKTSDFAKKRKAIAAINGGFFDIENKSSVTYLEKNDKIISETKKLNKLLNGIIILSKKEEIKIDTFKNDLFYFKSKAERFAIATGPLLIKDSTIQKLPNKNFIITRHPRTCLCKDKDRVVFVVIDGRNEDANGMTLIEVQNYLQSLGCIDAINLDGGGSSTMWTINKGVINTPTDENGEREVSNALLLIQK